MIPDQFLRLSDNQGPVDSSGNATYPSGAGGQAYSANYIDLLQTRDIGDGTELQVQLYCTQVLTTDQSWVVLVVQSPNVYSLANALIVGSFGLIGGATAGFQPIKKLAVGERLVCSLNPLTFSLGGRYLYLVYMNLGGITAIQGKFTVDICHSTIGTSGSLSYPGGFTVV